MVVASKLKVGDTCRVCVSWAKIPYRVKIVKLQKHGNQVFARIRWLTNQPHPEEEFGTLFAVDELKKSS